MVKSKPVAKDSVIPESKKVELVASIIEQEPPEIIVVPPDNHIFVCIDSISNIRPVLVSQESAIKLRLQFGDTFLSDSPVIQFPDPLEKDTSIGWPVSIPCFTSETAHLDLLTSSPVLVSVAEVNVKDFGSISGLPVVVEKEAEFTPFAFCSLDLLPLILGESEFRQTLLLEINRKGKSGGTKKDKKGKSPAKEKSPKKGDTSSKDKNSGANTGAKSKSSKSSATSKSKDTKGSMKSEEKDVTSVNNVAEPPSVASLPRITISASVEKSVVPHEIVEESNIMFITVESIYNVPLSIDGDSSEFAAGTLIPTEFDTEQVVRFTNGVLKKEPDKERMKRWMNIDHFPGKSACTQYAISEDLYPVRNRLNVDLCSVMSGDGPRVEWNKVKRSWISSSGAEYLGDYIAKHKMWMLEVMITSKAAGKKAKGKGEVNAEPPSDGVKHFVAFLDVSHLSFPGIHSVRCVGQLYTYCKDEVVAKCGSRSQTVLTPPPLVKASEGKGKGKAKSKSEKKGKSGTETKSKGSKKESKNESKKGSSKKGESPEVPPVEVEVPVEDVPCEFTPWVNEEGEPVFVLVGLELMRPLKARKTNEELFAEAEQLIPPIPEEPEHVLAARKAGEDHAALIHKLAKRFTKEYHSFLLHRRKKNLCINVGDQNTRDFYQYLKENGTIGYVKEKLTHSLDVLIKKKLGYDVAQKADQDIKVKHKFVSDLYVRLFEEVNTIINMVIDTATEAVEPVVISDSQIRMLGLEAQTTGEASLQRCLYYENLLRQALDVDSKYIFSQQLNDLDTALEHTKKELIKDRNSKEGILLYAVLLTKKGDLKKARLFFQVAVAKYPQSLFSGYMISLFYLMTDNKTGAEVSWATTRKLTANKPQTGMKKVFPQLLDWDPNMYDLKSVHLKSAQLLLFVRIFTLEFAYLALEQELQQRGPSEPYYYLLAICHFRSHRFQEASAILEQILVEKPRRNHLRRLLAHCQHEMGRLADAIMNYEFVVETSVDGTPNHLAHIRLGEHYLETGDYSAAKAIYFESCRFTPTARSWLGVGIALYMEGDYKESEKALTEANILDRALALIWGYLTLVNLQLCRLEQFEQCYCRAVRYDLKDEKVLGMIRDLMQLQGFAEPFLLHSLKSNA